MTHTPPKQSELRFISPDNEEDVSHSSQLPFLNTDEIKSKEISIENVIEDTNNEKPKNEQSKNYSTFNNNKNSNQKKNDNNHALYENASNDNNFNAQNIDIQKTYENESLKNKEWILMGKITIFMFAFVTCLILHYFPTNPYSYNLGWMQFSFTINILACITGILGIYTFKQRLVSICWQSLLFSLLLIVILTIIYLFGSEFDTQVNNRCYSYSSNSIKINNCEEKIKNQMRWQISGLATVYVIGAVFAINILLKVSECIGKQLKNEIRMNMHEHMMDDGNLMEEEKNDVIEEEDDNQLSSSKNL